MNSNIQIICFLTYPYQRINQDVLDKTYRMNTRLYRSWGAIMPSECRYSWPSFFTNEGAMNSDLHIRWDRRQKKSRERACELSHGGSEPCLGWESIQRAAKKFFCFAKHHPGSARQKYTQPGKRNLADLCILLMWTCASARPALTSYHYQVKLSN